MRLRPAIALLLIVIGEAAGLICDHSHVVTGTSEYLPPSRAVPFLRSSPAADPDGLLGLAPWLVPGTTHTRAERYLRPSR